MLVSRSGAPRAERSRWGGFRRDPGGHFLQGDHKRRVRLGIIILVVAVLILLLTALIARRSDNPQIKLIDTVGDDSTGVALASAEGTAPTPAASTTGVPQTTVVVTSVPPATVPPTTVPPTTVPSTTVPPTTVPTTVPPTTVPPTTVPPTTVPPPTTLPTEAAAAPVTTATPVTEAPAAPVDGSASSSWVVNGGRLDEIGLHQLMWRADGSSLLRAPTPERPLRIYVGGDSMAGTPGFALGNLARRNPLLDVTEDQRTSTGLVATWYFNWQDYMRAEVSPQPYDVVIMMMGGNDGQRFDNVPGSVVGDDAWAAEYGRRMERVMRSARSFGRLVIWIGMPPVTPPNIVPIVPRVNALAAGLANRLENVEYVDAFTMFSDAEGQFTTHLDDANGKRVQIRSGDGVHFANISGYWLAEAVLDLVQADVDSATPIR